MISTILTFHLAMAAIYIVALTIVGAASIIRKAVPVVATSAYISFSAIIVSGAGMVALSPKVMTHFCASALIATAFGVVISKVYKRRVVASHAV